MKSEKLLDFLTKSEFRELRDVKSNLINDKNRLIKIKTSKNADYHVVLKITEDIEKNSQRATHLKNMAERRKKIYDLTVGQNKQTNDD